MIKDGRIYILAFIAILLLTVIVCGYTKGKEMEHIHRNEHLIKISEYGRD